MTLQQPFRRVKTSKDRYTIPGKGSLYYFVLAFKNLCLKGLLTFCFISTRFGTQYRKEKCNGITKNNLIALSLCVWLKASVWNNTCTPEHHHRPVQFTLHISTVAGGQCYWQPCLLTGLDWRYWLTVNVNVTLINMDWVVHLCSLVSGLALSSLIYIYVCDLWLPCVPYIPSLLYCLACSLNSN